MNDLLLIAYECLAVILPFLITFLVLGAIYRYKKIPQTKTRFILLFIFALYVFAVFYFTGVGTIFDLQRYGIRIDADKVNYLPFSRDIDVVGYFLNILLFVPFGILVPLIWTNAKGIRYILISGFSFSLLIEISQSFNNRQTDVDDLILNTLGALIGYLLFRVLLNKIKRTANPVSNFKFELVVYFLSMFLGHFFIFNELGMAKILYGF